MRLSLFFGASEQISWVVEKSRNGRPEVRKPSNMIVDEYIGKASELVQQMMKQIRSAIRSLAPEAEEQMS